MRGEATQNVVRQGRWPFDNDVTHWGMASELSVMHSLPVGMRNSLD